MKYEKPSSLFGMIEQTRLSRLPNLTNGEPFKAPTIPFPKQSTVCAACGVRIDHRDERPFEIGVCSKCLKIHLAVDEKISANAKAKNRKWLEKYQGGQR